MNDVGSKIVHRIKEALGSKKKLVTVCGLEEKWNPKDGIPEEFSVWHAEVTCEACRL